jgi:hypothetical protein
MKELIIWLKGYLDAMSLMKEVKPEHMEELSKKINELAAVARLILEQGHFESAVIEYPVTPVEKELRSEIEVLKREIEEKRGWSKPKYKIDSADDLPF